MNSSNVLKDTTTCFEDIFGMQRNQHTTVPGFILIEEVINIFKRSTNENEYCRKANKETNTEVL